jgi:2-polyprenyl-3-methyl-5-hydroxy-6-metoxy-1,4-benzoquinol methylase
MPQISKAFLFTIARYLEVFLKLDASVVRAPNALDKRIQGTRQHPEDHAPRTEQKVDAEKLLTRKFQQERERRRVAESKLKQLRNEGSGVSTLAGVGQTQALPEPDGSINRRQVFRSLVSPLKPGKMLDLGTGPGTFSLAAAQLGWEVTAVDARTTRTPDPDAEKNLDRAELIRSVRWVEADVREFPIRSGEYDLICIFGLLHHLEVDDHIKLLKRCSDTLTLLDVRIAPEVRATEGSYEGWHRRERGETQEERAQIPTTSWGNELSFHHTEESLLRLLRDCGYSKVLPMRPPHHLNYTFYLCLPSPAE